MKKVCMYMSITFISNNNNNNDPESCIFVQILFTCISAFAFQYMDV